MTLLHTWGKLFQAVSMLVGGGDLQTRLRLAAGYVSSVDLASSDMADEHWRERFGRLQSLLAARDLNALDPPAAEWLAEEILSLFIDVAKTEAEESYLRHLIDDPSK